MNKLQYLEGERNDVADALSRIRLQPKNSALNLIENRAAYATSPSMGDTLPQESSAEAVQDEGLIVPTFLVYLRRQQDLQMRQLSSPTFIPACTSGVSSSPVVITCSRPLIIIHQCGLVARYLRLIPPGSRAYRHLENFGLRRKMILHCRNGSCIIKLRRRDSGLN